MYFTTFLGFLAGCWFIATVQVRIFRRVKRATDKAVIDILPGSNITWAADAAVIIMHYMDVRVGFRHNGVYLETHSGDTVKSIVERWEGARSK